MFTKACESLSISNKSNGFKIARMLQMRAFSIIVYHCLPKLGVNGSEVPCQIRSGHVHFLFFTYAMDLSTLELEM
jgi:hypothetical protein